MRPSHRDALFLLLGALVGLLLAHLLQVEVHMHWRPSGGDVEHWAASAARNIKNQTDFKNTQKTKTHSASKVRRASKSQHGEEMYAYEHFFFGRRDGVFLEMGGRDGILGSNTFALEKVLGWNGVLIEGSPSSFRRLSKTRSRQRTVNAVVCDKEQMVHWLEHQSTCCRGIAEFMSEGYRSMWYPGLSNTSGAWRFDTNMSSRGAVHSPRAARTSIPITPVPCRPLSLILGDVGRTHFDFFSLDVEGAELEVLKSVDFGKVTFDVMCVEAARFAPARNQQVTDFLLARGYEKYRHTEGGGEGNDWYVRRGFVPRQAPRLSVTSAEARERSSAKAKAKAWTRWRSKKEGRVEVRHSSKSSWMKRAEKEGERKWKQ